MKLIHNLILVPACALSVACGNATGSNVDIDSTNASADSIVPPTVAPLPDTIYSSASAVNAIVSIADTTCSGTISDLNSLYSNAQQGAFTFRGNALRNADFGGRLKSIPTQLELQWEFTTNEDYSPTDYGAWGGGTGWTGQPLYVEWPDSCIDIFKKNNLNAAKHEIILGSLCGDVYFIDFESGKQTRQPITTGNPIKGTPSVDPTLNGNLYVGQGVPSHTEISALVIDMFHGSISHRFGPDPKALRHWHAYDSSPVRVGQFLFRPGENGTLYKYTVVPGGLKLHSSVKYTVGGRAPGMEASMAVYRNYGITADNAGNIICFNLNSLTPVWHYKLPDDTDATPVIVDSNGKAPAVFVGCEVEHEGVTQAAFAKLDVLTGRQLWINRYSAQQFLIENKHFDGGFYSTALPGKGDCNDLIFVNCVKNTDGQNGNFVAMKQSTGEIAYEFQLKYYAWSSPVGFLGPDNKYYVVTADCSGNMYLISGADGKIIFQKRFGANFESSPVVVGNSLVVGSRGNKIYKIAVK